MIVHLFILFVTECPYGYERDSKGCQDIDECKLKGKEACKKENICHNKVGTFACECVYQNEESVYNKVCVHKIPNVTKSGRDLLILPPNPEVAAAAITMSTKVIAFLFYVFVMMSYTVVKSIYLHCTTESWPPPKYWIENKKKKRKGYKDMDEYKSNQHSESVGNNESKVCQENIGVKEEGGDLCVLSEEDEQNINVNIRSSNTETLSVGRSSISSYMAIFRTASFRQKSAQSINITSRSHSLNHIQETEEEEISSDDSYKSFIYYWR